MNQEASRLIGFNLHGYQLVRYSATPSTVRLTSVEVIRLKGQTLEKALASKESFFSAHLTSAGLAQVCKEIKNIHRSEIPDFFFGQDRGLSRRFVAGGTLLVRKGVKYALAFSFIGHEWFVRPVALSIKNTPDYYFLVKKGSA